MRIYRNLKIWEQGIDIVKQVYVLVEQLPSTEKFGLKSQITRAAVSIPSNIAEGFFEEMNDEESIAVIYQNNHLHARALQLFVHLRPIHR